MLSATTRRHAVGLACVEHVGGAAEVHGAEVVDVLAGAAEEGGAVDRTVATLRRPEHIVGVGDVAPRESTPMAARAAASSGL